MADYFRRKKIIENKKKVVAESLKKLRQKLKKKSKEDSIIKRVVHKD